VNAKLLYLDSSAIIKVVVAEPESKELMDFLTDWPNRISSELARTEVLRALRSSGVRVPEFRRGQKTLDRIGLISIDSGVLSGAALFKPVTMRSLDAIHLATALSLGKDLAGMVAYDARLAEAAARAKLQVWSPGR
jgi:predicted nucleic acid-binding protein